MADNCTSGACQTADYEPSQNTSPPAKKRKLTYYLDESAKKIVKRVKDILLCPTCLDTVRAPFKMCITGHVVCGFCVNNLSLNSCPTCFKSFVVDDPIVVKKLLEEFPVTCRYSAFGCDHEFNSGDHETYCHFRPLSCNHRQCNSVVPVYKMAQHAETKHLDSQETKVLRNKLICKIPAQKFSFESFQVIVFDKLFRIIFAMDVEERVLKVFFHAVPVKKPDCAYYAEVNFERKNHFLTGTVRATAVLTRWEEKYFKPEKEILTEEYFMKVPKSTLNNFIDNEGFIQCSLFFFRGEKV